MSMLRFLAGLVELRWSGRVTNGDICCCEGIGDNAQLNKGKVVNLWRDFKIGGSACGWKNVDGSVEKGLMAETLISDF